MRFANFICKLDSAFPILLADFLQYLFLKIRKFHFLFYANRFASLFGQRYVLFPELQSRQTSDQGCIRNVFLKKIIYNEKHSVVCYAADDNIFSLCHSLIFCIERSALYLFHLSPMKSHNHCPIYIRRDLGDAKLT